MRILVFEDTYDILEILSNFEIKSENFEIYTFKHILNFFELLGFSNFLDFLNFWEFQGIAQEILSKSPFIWEARREHDFS